MNLVDIQKTTSNRGVFNLYAIGDMHLDSRKSNHERARQYINMIAKDPSAIAVFVGDLMEGRVPGRKHFDADNVREDFLRHLRTYTNHGLDVAETIFRPLVKAGTPLVIVSGNHDEYLEEIGLSVALTQRLGKNAHCVGGEGFIRIRTGKPNMYVTTAYVRHGSGGGKRPGPKVNNMQAELEWVDADFVIQGHVHDGDMRIIHRTGINDKGTLQIVKRPVCLYRATAFVDRAVAGIVGYDGRQGYPAADEGLMYAHVDPSAPRITRVECEF